MKTQKVESNVKIYSTLKRCCTYQNVRPGAVQPVFSSNTLNGRRVGFAALPEKINGEYIFWVKGE